MIYQHIPDLTNKNIAQRNKLQNYIPNKHTTKQNNNKNIRKLL